MPIKIVSFFYKIQNTVYRIRIYCSSPYTIWSICQYKTSHLPNTKHFYCWTKIWLCSLQKIRHHYICQSVVNAKQKKSMNTPKGLTSYEKKHMPPFVVLKHWVTKLSAKPLTKSNSSSYARVIDHHWLSI